MDRRQCRRIFSAMRAGGYLDAIAAAGPDLERVRQYLDRFDDPDSAGATLTSQPTTYPSFPGLNHRRFHSPADVAAVRELESAYPTILAEVERLGSASELEYAPLPRIVSRILSLAIRDLGRINWGIYPLYYMGVNVDLTPPTLPATLGIIESLHENCVRYPWGDALVSAQRPRSKLPPHCSVDNVRIRCHLGLSIPSGAGIRVGGETRTWEPGECLVFEDSFEHEVWNDSDERRVVLIVDLWHPDLSLLEREALTAGFRKREVRSIFMRQRIERTDNPGRYLDCLERDLAGEQSDPLIRKYWQPR